MVEGLQESKQEATKVVSLSVMGEKKHNSLTDLEKISLIKKKKKIDDRSSTRWDFSHL